MATSEEEQPLPQLAVTRAHSDRRHRPAAVAEAGRARRQAASAGGLQPARDAQRARAAQPSPLLRCCQRGADAHCNCVHMHTHMAPIARAHMQDLASARARCPDCTCGYSEQRGGYSLCNSAASMVQVPWLAAARAATPPPLQRPARLLSTPRENALAAPMPRRGCGGAPMSAQRRRLRRLWPIQARVSDATRRRAG